MIDKDMRRSPLKTPLAVLRKTLEMTLPQFAEIAGLNSGTLQQIELGNRPMSEEVGQKIADETGVSLSWLMNGDPSAPIVGAYNCPYDKEVFERTRRLNTVPVDDVNRVILFAELVAFAEEVIFKGMRNSRDYSLAAHTYNAAHAKLRKAFNMQREDADKCEGELVDGVLDDLETKLNSGKSLEEVLSSPEMRRLGANPHPVNAALRVDAGCIRRIAKHLETANELFSDIRRDDRIATRKRVSRIEKTLLLGGGKKTALLVWMILRHLERASLDEEAEDHAIHAIGRRVNEMVDPQGSQGELNQNDVVSAAEAAVVESIEEARRSFRERARKSLERSERAKGRKQAKRK